MSCWRRKRGEKTIIVKGITGQVGNYLKTNKVNLSELSRNAGIPYNLLYASVWDKNRVRELRVDEFFSICNALGVSADTFQPADMKEGD